MEEELLRSRLEANKVRQEADVARQEAATAELELIQARSGTPNIASNGE